MRNTLLAIAMLAAPSVASATPAENGIFVNTEALNGIFVNGIFVNGIFVNGRDMSKGQITAAVFGDETIAGVRPSWQAYKPGHYLYYPHLEGTGLAGWAWDYAAGGWVWRSGEWFEGTLMPAGIYDKTTGTTEIVTVRITDVASYPGVSMLLHTVEVQAFDASNTAHWAPMCGTDAYGQPVPAIALRGEWSLTEYSSVGGDQISDSPYRVTFACATGALGKCAADCSDKGLCTQLGVRNALGYRRWEAPHYEYAGGTFVWRDDALDHQSCTRMVRADYCGDGRTWTATGTPIDVYDRVGVNTAWYTSAPAWMYEATWNADGAVRIACERLYEGPVTCPGGGSARWAVIAPSTTSWACYRDDGLADPAARLGNMRKRTIALPGPVTPIY